MDPDNGKARTSVLTREQILKAQDVKIEMVDVSEWWGGCVYVRSLTGKQRDAFEASRYKWVGDKIELQHDNTRARLLAMTVSDEHGTLLFTEGDIELLGQKDAAPLDKLFDVAQRLSAMRPKDLEEKLKNFGAALTGNSSSVSPTP